MKFFSRCRSLARSGLTSTWVPFSRASIQCSPAGVGNWGEGRGEVSVGVIAISSTSIDQGGPVSVVDLERV